MHVTSRRLDPQFPGNWPYQVEVVRENTVGALHEPTGPIFMSVEILAEARSGAELAGVLAHFALRHGTRRTPATFMGGDSHVVPIGMRAFRRANESRYDDWAVIGLVRTSSVFSPQLPPTSSTLHSPTVTCASSTSLPPSPNYHRAHTPPRAGSSHACMPWCRFPHGPPRR